MKCVCGNECKKLFCIDRWVWLQECELCSAKRREYDVEQMLGSRHSRRFSGPNDYTWEEKIALTALAQGVDYVPGRNDRPPRMRSGWLINAKIEDLASRRRYDIVRRIDSVDVAPLPTTKRSGNRRNRTKMGKAREILGSVTECSYCGRAGDRDIGPDGKKWHIDHIIPISKSGTNELDNLCKACATCNTKKGDRLVAVMEGALTAQDVLDAAMENLQRSA